MSPDYIHYITNIRTLKTMTKINYFIVGFPSMLAHRRLAAL